MSDLRRAGDRGVLLAANDPPATARAIRALRGPFTCVDIVPGAQSVLVIVASPGEVDPLRAALDALPETPSAAGTSGDLVDIDVDYDGPDLDAVASATGMRREEVVAMHSGAEYTAAFGGFAAGFFYLRGLPTPLRLPRRAEPRTTVPAGSVAIADSYAAVYPRATPGGWHLLGRTDATLFDAGRDPPSLLAPGARVRFRHGHDRLAGP